MLKENDKLLEELSKLFLSYKDPDEAYCRILREIKYLYNEKVFVDINEVQKLSYNEKGDE